MPPQGMQQISVSRARIYPAIVIAAAVVMAIRIGAVWHVFNDIIDEPYHLGSGVAALEAKRHVYGIQHPPLPRLVAALPLYVAGVRSGDAMLGQVVDDLRAFEVGHDVLMRGRLPYWVALILARSAMLVFPLLCVGYVYLLGSYLGNRLVGCVAAVMFSTDPTLLGHGSWVTADVAACAGFLAGSYHGIKLVARPILRRSIAAGVAIGFALACKFSCVLVLPALMIVWMLRGRRALATARRTIAFGAVSLVVAFGVLWGTYGFDFGRIDRLEMPDPAAVDRLPGWFRRLPLPMPTATAGLAVLVQHKERGHRAYLNGQFTRNGWWYYFPLALFLKSPIALLAGIGLSGIVLPGLRRRRMFRIAIVLVLPAVFMLAAMTSRINIGVRHILPVIPFLYLFVAMILARGKLILLAAGLALLALVETAVVHPDYVAFFNKLVGGPRSGEKYLLDSNLDWGQDLWRARAWLDQNAHERVVTLRAFGNSRLREWKTEGTNLSPEGSAPQGLVLISKNYLYDVYPYIVADQTGQPEIQPSIAWLRNRQPVARIGYSINVYDLDSAR